MKLNRQQIAILRYNYSRFICKAVSDDINHELAYLWKAEYYTIWKGK